MATIAQRIKEALNLRNMKQADLVEKTGIGKSSISTYISGEYEPKQKNLYKIAQALEVSESWLMGLDVPMERVQSPSETDLIENKKTYQINIKNLQLLLDDFPEQTLYYLSQFCRNKRIANDRTEKSVTEEAGVSLEKYLAFELHQENIGADNIAKILSVVMEQPSYIIGYLTGTLMGNLDNSEADTLIDKIYSGNELLNRILKLMKNLSPEGLDYLLGELQKELLNSESDNSSDIIAFKNVLSQKRFLNAAHTRTDITPTPEGQAHDEAIMDDDSEWEDVNDI
ncbi:MAG TPA: hypothetical protein DCZ40_12160 [Lachnospiraceae bacterium]|nr:hypothetical protein [Lachnospiraceae bacterium]